MKAIMISIKPEYVADILNGKKTIEIRKTMPKCDLPIDVYIYCTKDKKHKLEYCDINGGCWSANDGGDYYNGKVVAKFTLNNVEKWDIWQKDLEEKIKLACLSIKEFDDYSKGQVAYAIHISDLEIFDKPKELSEFKIPCDFKCPEFGCCYCHKNTKLTKAPQSWCYVEE